MIIRRKDEIIREVMPLALFEDLKEAMFLMEYTSGVRPYITDWLDAVFLKILNAKTEVDKKTVVAFMCECWLPICNRDIIAIYCS
jgi:hypothetical protein